MNTCSFPRENGDPCGKRAVAIYTLAKEDYLRCRLHDTRSVRETADRMGATRRDLTSSTDMAGDWRDFPAA